MKVFYQTVLAIDISSGLVHVKCQNGSNIIMLKLEYFVPKPINLNVLILILTCEFCAAEIKKKPLLTTSLPNYFDKTKKPK